MSTPWDRRRPPLLPDVVRRAARAAPARVALWDRRGGELTYAELDARSDRLAASLLAAGVAPGERLAVWSDTNASYVELYLAAAKSGIVIAPVNSLFREREAEYVLQHSGAVALAYADVVAPLVERVAGRDEFRLLVHLGEGADDRGSVPYDRLLSGGSGSRLPLPPAGDPWVIAYTSGTTGWPKGAVITHAACAAAMQSMVGIVRASEGARRGFTANMSFVASAIAGIFPLLSVGGSIGLLSGVGPGELFERVERDRLDVIGIPGSWLPEFTSLAAASPRTLARLSTLIQGGSKVRPGDLAPMAEIIGDRLVASWGMTENCGVPVAATRPGDWLRPGTDVFSTVGRAVPGTTLALRGDGGQPLPADGDTVGELWVRSPSLFDRYWTDPAATAASFHDGWWASGDLGAIDPAGYVEILDRRTDLIVSGGMNIYPSELERVISELPGVVDVVVIGSPHERWGRTPVAVVVADERARLDEHRVVEWCVDRLASYKKPTRVVFRDSLPRSAAGKVLRRELAAGLGGQ